MEKRWQYNFFFVPLPTDMKHTVFFVKFVVPIVLLLIACGDKNDGDMIDFDRISVERTISINNSKDAPQCHVHLEILQARNSTSVAADSLINEAIVKKIFDMEHVSPQAAADSFANTYTHNYQNYLAPLYREDHADTNKRPWYEYRYVINTETCNNADGITNYLITLDYYEGGVHGINQLLTLNFDNKTGRLLTLHDIFGNDYELSLGDKLLQALLKKTGDNDLEALHQRGYLYSMNMFIPENYIISNDKVTFIYNPYEIAAYSEGKIELDIKR